MSWSYLAYWFSGFALTTSLWWWHGNDIRLSDVLTFSLGAAIMGPGYLFFYLWSLWRENAPRRDPIILIRGRGK